MLLVILHVLGAHHSQVGVENQVPTERSRSVAYWPPLLSQLRASPLSSIIERTSTSKVRTLRAANV